MEWAEHVEREQERYRDGQARLADVDDPDARQKQLTRMGNAAGGPGLALLMQGRDGEATEWFSLAAERYRESFADAPPGSWGRPIGAIKNLLLGGDWEGAEAAAEWVSAGAGSAESPIGKYAACLAFLVLERDREARVLADNLRTHDGFPIDVADALAMIPRCRGLRLRRGVGARIVRDARRVPRGHPGCGHGHRPADPRDPAGHGG